MPPVDQQRADQLLALARDRFDPNLADIEVQVLTHSCRYEDPPDWTPDLATPDPTRHETTGRPLPGAPLPTIRPTLIRWLLTDPAATALLEPRGLRVWGARLAEPLDLIGCTIPARLELRYCLVEAPILLANASLPTLSLRNATLQQTLDAPFLKLHGPLLLDDITAAETLNFNGATITGEARLSNTTLTATTIALSMQGASITNDLHLRPSLQSSGCLYMKGIHVGGLISLRGASLTSTAEALVLDDAVVDGALYLTGKFESAGEIRMIGAHIASQLACNGAKLTAGGDALSMDQAQIGGGVFLADNFESAGTIRLPGAHISGDFDCSGSKLTATGNALSLQNAKVDGNVFPKRLECAGTIQLTGARIGGQLNCGGAKLTTEGDALSMDHAHIGGSVFLNEGFESAGEIRLLGAHVGGQLNCRGAKLATAGDALSMDGAQVSGGVFLDGGFKSAGTIRMNGAQVTGQLSCRGAKLTTLGDALSMDQAQIDGIVLLDGSFESAGVISLTGAKISGQLNCTGASIQYLQGENMEVKDDLWWQQIKDPKQTSLNLVGAKIKAIRDDHASWPAQGNLHLEGLHVEDLIPLHDRNPHTNGRIAWLNLQPKSQLAEPQPWMHLAAHLEAKGHKRAAKRVIYELKRHQARANWKNRKLKFLGHPWALAFARLEEQPFRILFPILILAALSGATFYRYRAHFSPTAEAAYPKVAKADSKDPALPVAYPEFHSFVYTLENVLPVIKLGQDDKWAPNPNLPKPIANPNSHLYRWLVVLRWTLILSGWVMGGILAAAVSARFRN